MKTMKDRKAMCMKARRIAHAVHLDETDPDGKRTIDRIEDIVSDIDDDLLKTIAYLHRGVSRSLIKTYDLKVAGFPRKVVMTLACLRRNSFEKDDDYIDRVFENDMASYVLLSYMAHDAFINAHDERARIECAKMRIKANKLSSMWLERR